MEIKNNVYVDRSSIDNVLNLSIQQKKNEEVIKNEKMIVNFTNPISKEDSEKLQHKIDEYV